MLIKKGKTGKGGDGTGVATVVVPPDGGWGWMVVFGSFMIHLIADGVAYSLGVYQENFLSEFGAWYSEVKFLGPLMLAVTLGSGPIASMLTNKYGCRLVAILGTVIAAFGFSISIFAPNFYFLYFSFGIVAGIGLGFANFTAIVAVSFYFEKRRSLAIGLAVCGSGFGTFIFAPLTQILLAEYGWRETVLLETGLLLNCIPCAAVFRPVEAPRKKSVPQANQAERSDAHELTEKANGFDGEVRQAAPAAAAEAELTTTSEDSVTNRRRRLSSTSSSSVVGRVTAGPRESEDGGGGGGGGCGGGGRKGRSSSKVMDCRLMIDPCFLLFAISNLLTSIGYVIAQIVLPYRATIAGLEESQAAFLISIVGISSTVGLIVFMFLADCKCVNRLVLYNTALVLCGIMSLLSALCYNYPLVAAYAASFGLFIGVYILLTPIVIIDLFGLDKLSNAFGIVLLFQGIGTFLGPPIAGAVFDVTQDYNILFYLMGACITLSGAMLYFILCIQRHQQRTSYGKDGGHLATDGALKKSTPAAVVLPSTEEQMLMAA